MRVLDVCTSNTYIRKRNSNVAYMRVLRRGILLKECTSDTGKRNSNWIYGQVKQILRRGTLLDAQDT